MEARDKSLIRYSDDIESPERDSPKGLLEALRTARNAKHWTQAELAGRLGLHQRQISDLERGTVDPRLSTVRNVARALNLELTLVPHHLIPVVDALVRGGADEPARPLYSLAAEDPGGYEAGPRGGDREPR
jgi:transcriptional regulator with XRE-family HTH domain